MAAMMWGLDAASTMMTDVRRLNFTYNLMVAKMLKVSKKDNEGWQEYHKRRQRMVRSV